MRRPTTRRWPMRCTHWTRHERRLDRDFGRKQWGDDGYAREELVAELGAAFLCADLGLTLEDREDHAAYIGHCPAGLSGMISKASVFLAAKVISSPLARLAVR